MLLQPADARRFIDTYQEVAVAIHSLLQRPLPANPTYRVKNARQLISEDADLLDLKGKILCDGLIVHIAALGPELRRSCNERYRQLEASGLLHIHPAASSLWRSAP